MAVSKGSSETREEFAARVGSILLNGFTCLGLSLGHEVGLFDILADMKEPKTSQEIADAGHLNERYVREWLGAMVTSHIVELDSTGEKYFLPPNRAPALTLKGELAGDIIVTSLIPTFGGDVYSQVKACFQKDGPRGVSFNAYTTSYEVVRKMTTSYFEAVPIASVLSKYPELAKKLDKGINVVDIGCGYGVTTIELAKAYPNSHFCGVDLHEGGIKAAEEKSKSLNLENIEFVTGDDTELPAEWNSKFDFAFLFETLHDQSYPDKALSEVYRILTQDGIAMVVEPKSFTKLKDNLENVEGIELFYMASLMFCMPTSLHSEGGMGFGACWGWEKAVEVISAAGLEVCSVVPTPKFPYQYLYCKKK